jgi:hypothetical protein
MRLDEVGEVFFDLCGDRARDNRFMVTARCVFVSA